MSRSKGKMRQIRFRASVRLSLCPFVLSVSFKWSLTRSRHAAVLGPEHASARHWLPHARRVATHAGVARSLLRGARARHAHATAPQTTTSICFGDFPTLVGSLVSSARSGVPSSVVNHIRLHAADVYTSRNIISLLSSVLFRTKFGFVQL